MPNRQSGPGRPGRRELLAYSAFFGSAFMARQGLAAAAASAAQAPPAGNPVESMKKSINLWAFPYPDTWTLKECLQIAKDAGFDAVEPNFNLEGEFSAESTDDEIRAIKRMADEIGIAISGVCSFLFWPYSMTHPDPGRRARGIRLAERMAEAAALLGTDNLLVVPGAVYAPWLEDPIPVPNDVCERRAKEAVRALIPKAEQAGVTLNIENIFANGFLFSPQEMADFVDSFASETVKVHFDTGNIMQYQFPEHWVPILGSRIKNVHLKEWDKRTQEFNLNTFRTLLDGTTDWPALVGALEDIGYDGYLTFEYFHPFQHYAEALIYQTSDALDWILRRRG